MLYYQMPSPKFTREEKTIANMSLFECTEEEKKIRKNVLKRMQDYEERKRFFNKSKLIVKQKLEYARSILSSRNIDNCTKERIAKETGKYMIDHGKERLGLQYLNEALSYREGMYGRNHPSTLSEYGNYNKISQRAITSYNSRMQNSRKLKEF